MPLVILLLILLPTIAFGADPVKYKPLIEGIGLGGEGSFDAFINQLYIFSITLAALLAVIKIIVAGVKYSLSEIVNTKGEAKGEIKGALFGLLIVMSAVLILEVINPQLVNINFNPEPVKIVKASQPVAIVGTNVPAEYTNVAMGIKEKGLCESAGGIFVPEKETCFVKGKKDNRSGPSVDVNMWTARVDGVSSIKGTQSGEYGHITQQEVREIPRGAFLGNKDFYDDTGTWNLCNNGSRSDAFYFMDTAVTKIRTCSGDRRGTLGVSQLPQNEGHMDVDIWISTSPGNKGTAVRNCGPESASFSGNIDWLQPTGLATHEEKWGPGSGSRQCVLADDSIYYLNIEPNPACVPSSTGRCHILANLTSG